MSVRFADEDMYLYSSFTTICCYNYSRGSTDLYSSGCFIPLRHAKGKLKVKRRYVEKFFFNKLNYIISGYVKINVCT